MHPLSFDWFYFGSIERLLGPFAVLIAGGFLIGFYWLNTSPDAFRRFLGWAVFAFFGFACLSAFKTGSGVGYFEDWSYLAVLTVFLHLIHQLPIALHWAAATCVCVCVHIASSSWLRYHAQGDFEPQYVLEHNLATFLKNEKNLRAGQYVYVCPMQVPYGGWYLRHLLLSQVVVPFDDLLLKSETMKTFEFTVFNDMINTGRIRFVVAQRGLPLQTAWQHPISGYRLVGNMGDYNIYESERFAQNR